MLPCSQVSFDWRRDEFPERNFPERGRIGFIAQDLEKVVPEVVETDQQVRMALLDQGQRCLTCVFAAVGMENCSLFKLGALIC